LLALLLLATLLGAVSLALLAPSVQTRLAQWLGERLSAQAGTTISIDRVELRLFGPNRLHGVYIADLKGDTLIAADELWIRGLRVHPGAHLLEVRRVELHRSRFALSRAKDDLHSNLTNLLNKLSSADSTGAPSAPWRFHCREVDIRALHFSYHDDNIPVLPFGLDVDHVDVPSAQILGRELAIAGDSVCFNFDQLTLTDRCGLVLNNLTGAARVAPRGIRVDGLHLITGPQRKGSIGSEVRGDVDLRTQSLGDFDDLETKVFIHARLDSSRLQFADVALFAPDLEGVDYAIALRGMFQGPVNDLKGRHMDLYFGQRSAFHGDVGMTGLPDIRNTFIVLDAREIHTDPADLATLPIPPFLQKRRLVVPPEVGRLGRMTFRGNFTGFINSFTTYGDASTAAGPLNSDISFDRDTVTGYFQLRGKLATTGFDLGKVLETSAVGHIAMNMKVQAKGKDLNTLEAELEGTVPELGLAGFTIGGITLNGKLEKNLFNGELHCDDPKLKLDFNGLADLRGRWPDVDFTADVRRMDLRALGLVGGSGYSDLVMEVRAKGELAPDSLKGSVHMEDVSFCNDSLDLHLGNIDLVSEREAGVPVMRLESSMADAEVRGPFYPTLLPKALQGVLSGVFPALERPMDLPEDGQDLTFDVTVKDAQPLLNVLVPGLILSAGSHATGNFNDRKAELGLDAHFKQVGYKGFMGDSLVVSVEKNMDLLAFKVESNGAVRKDSMEMRQLEIVGKAYQDQVLLQASWVGRKKGNEGDLNLEATVNGPDSYTIELKPSKLVFDRGEWTNTRTARIQVDSTTITVDTLELVNADQVLRLGGTIGKDPSMALSFDLHDVRLENLRPLYQGPALHGALSGDGRVFDVYHSPYLLSYLCIDSLAFEDKTVGDLVFTAAYRNGEDAIDVNGTLQHDTLQALRFDGRLTPGQADELQVKLKMDHFDLRFLNPYLPSGISDVQGTVTGTINVTGKLAEPQVNGEALLTDAGLKINYLNTKYTFTHPVSIRPDAFFMDNVTLYDQQGGTAHASAFTVYHHGLKDWNFDVAIQMDSLLVLDTGPADNSLYYGRAIGRGDLNVEGYADNLGITVNAKTMPGTSLHFPLGASTDVSGIPFVRFTGKDDQTLSENESVDLSGVHMDMNVEVTPDAKFELIFDPTVGDILRGRGQGNIAMSVTPSGDFSMKGDVAVVDGDYLFTLRNLVNKRFGIEPGGHINWFGDPFDASIDIDAVYRLRAALYDVMPAALRTEAYRKRVPVEVTMHLTQKLMNPDIGFEVRLPTVDEGVRTQVNSAMASTDDLNKQVFSLIVLNRFLPSDKTNTAAPGNTNTTDIGQGTLATGTELLSNQVSNWLSGISRSVDLGVNWRTGDAISQDEFELALSTAIFNDRLQLTTNFGLSYGAGGTQQGTNSFIGDFSAEYALTQDGKLHFKGFSQSNDRNLNQVDQAATTQGIGLAYRVEFDNFREVIKPKKPKAPEP